jgi:hypothetical protein
LINSGAMVLSMRSVIGILGCLQVLYQLVRLSNIELGKEHEEVVRKLWIKKDNTNRLTWAEFDELIGDSLPSKRKADILDDLNRLGIIAFDPDDDGIVKREFLKLEQ